MSMHALPHPRHRWVLLALYVLGILVTSHMLTKQSAAQCAPNDLFCISSLD